MWSWQEKSMFRICINGRYFNGLQFINYWYIPDTSNLFLLHWKLNSRGVLTRTHKWITCTVVLGHWEGSALEHTSLGQRAKGPSKVCLSGLCRQRPEIKGTLKAALRRETVWQSGDSEQKWLLTLSLGPTLADFLNIQQFYFGLEASFEPWFCQICGFSDSVLIDCCAHHKMTERHYP